ncbi:hypothetical protein H5410_053416 [Solanum commersonii]|uniref:Uncharacterized protein n=1 Tax=Solanum commersonii TaxID=4109 RepID=A0A9J5X5V0_SOLCO|nr:hypothetical protein H5410_053416 [Solanum commersonii]
MEHIDANRVEISLLDSDPTLVPGCPKTLGRQQHDQDFLSCQANRQQKIPSCHRLVCYKWPAYQRDFLQNTFKRRIPTTMSEKACYRGMCKHLFLWCPFHYSSSFSYYFLKTIRQCLSTLKARDRSRSNNPQERRNNIEFSMSCIVFQIVATDDPILLIALKKSSTGSATVLLTTGIGTSLNLKG